jgi:hypothetical protein
MSREIQSSRVRARGENFRRSHNCACEHSRTDHAYAPFAPHRRTYCKNPGCTCTQFAPAARPKRKASPEQLKRALARFIFDLRRSYTEPALQLLLVAIAAASCGRGGAALPVFAFGGVLLKDLSDTFPEPDVHPSVTNAGAVDYVVDRLQRAFWVWFVANQRDVLLKRKIMFWTVQLTVRDLRPVFVKIFGESPADVVGAA